MVLNEVAGSDVELLAVALDLQDGALHVTQQLLILQQRQGGSWEAAGPPRKQSPFSPHKQEAAF